MKTLLRTMAILTCACLSIAVPAFGQSGISVDVDQFGVGGYFRPGGITPIRLKLTSYLSAATPVWVQWQVPNADGDIVENGRSLGAVTPGTPAFTWLYAELPPDVTQYSVWTVRVFEEKDGVRGSEVGGTRISPTSASASAQSATQMVDQATGMIAVIGDKRLGLDDYSSKMSMRNNARPVGSFEDTAVAFGIKPTQLPDRWWGLYPGFDAVVWAGDRDSQLDLTPDQAEALHEYVRWGGHLVISLPSAGNPWGLGARGQTLLEDLLPCRTEGQVPRKDDAVKLAELLPVLSKFSDVTTLVHNSKQPEFSIRVFKDLRGNFNAIDNHYDPLIALPDGRVIAIQRLLGFGRVTVIGVDLSDGRLAGLGLPQGDAFWNRILGRRSDTPSPDELSAIEKQDRLNRESSGRENPLGSGPLITGRTNMQGKANEGLLLALVLFVSYWLLAGPAGFGILKHYGYVRHAWLAFAACAAAFTALAWGTVSLLPKQLEIKHITFLDHIARPANDPRSEEPQYQRALSFFSLYLPEYGSTPIAIASDPGQRDLLVSWTPPGQPPQHFPNVDRYRVDVARSPAAYSLPARSTATQLCAHWMGGLDASWGGLLRVDPNDPLTVTVDPTGETLKGKIINELPGQLTNVKVIWIKNNRLTRRTYAKNTSEQELMWVPNSLSGQMLNAGSMWAQSTWDQGAALDLGATASKPSPLQTNITKRYIDAYSQRDTTTSLSTTVRDDDSRNYIEMLSMFQQLDPPKYLRSPGQGMYSESAAFGRVLGRELDLSPWFARPCLIIIGYLEGSKCPVPIRVNGADQPPASDGLTVVRWIYPLPVEDKVAFSEAFPEDDQK